MARPRNYDEESLLGPDDFEARGPGRPPREPEAVPPFAPAKARGPRTTLADDMVVVIAGSLAQGYTHAKAASDAGTTKACLEQWLQRGQRNCAEGKDTTYAFLSLECERAKRHYEAFLIRLGDKGAQDKALNVRWITWRLGHLNRADFTEVKGGQGLSCFALMSTEEAVQSVHQLMADFLKRREEQEAEAHAAPAKDDDDDDDS